VADPDTRMKTENRNAKIHVAIISDDPLRVIGLRTLLKSERDIYVDTNGTEDSSLRIDIAIVRDSGDEVIERVAKWKNDLPGVRILVMGPGLDETAISRSLAAGASGYIKETASAWEIANAIRTVKNGFIWAPRRVVARMIEDFTGACDPRQRDRETLTDRDKEVLKLLVEGRSNKEIGAPLKIEERTVKAHVSRMMRKLGVTNRISLSLLAVRQSIINVS
jgi:DNA-binding NarL/FixJ family response regulator